MMKKIVLLALVVLFLLPTDASAFSLGVISDIHAGKQSQRKKSRINTLYPKRYAKNLKKIRKSNIGIVLNLGDTTNNGDKKYADKVKKELKKKTVIWVRGNHDTDKSWARFGAPSSYYSWDRDNWRIIVLDSSQIASNTLGGLDDEQLDWLREQLVTDKKVMIAMHHCIFEDNAMETLISRYSEFKSIVEEAGNVQYVMSGHEHARNVCKAHAGTEYCSVQSVSVRNHQGYYKTMELE